MNLTPDKQTGFREIGDRSKGLNFACAFRYRGGGVPVHHVGLAAFNVRVVLIARDQKEGTGIAIGEHSLSGDFPTIVDVVRAHASPPERCWAVQRDPGTREKQRL